MPAPDTAHQPATLTARQREDKAVSLRLGGATFEQVGQQLGLTGPGARTAMLRGLRRLTKVAEAEAEELRMVEVLRLDRCVSIATAIAFDAKQPADTRLRAVDRLIKAGEARARLLGFNTPSVLVGVDLSRLTDDQMQRIAKGENPLNVLASAVEPSLAEPPLPHPAAAPPAEEEDADEGEVVGDEVIF